MLELDEKALTDIVADVLQCSFGVSLEAENTDGKEEVDSSAMVSITGDWDGVILVGCAATLARHLTAEIIGVGVEEVEEDQLRDTLGELANMIGGKVKCSLPPSCKLSLPMVVAGHEVVIRVPGTLIRQDIHLSAAHSPMRVTIVERQPEAA